MHPFLRVRLKFNLKKGPKKNKVTKNCKEHFFSTIDQVQSFGKSGETPERS